MRLIFATGVLVGALLSFVVSAFAADSALCVGYVQAALQDVKAANELGCGFDPNNPMWSSDPNVHASWCKNASNDAVIYQLGHSDAGPDTRQQQLQACTSCRRYTDKAMAQEAEDQKYFCHFAGTSPRWPKTDGDGDIFSKHMHWCMGLSAVDVDYSFKSAPYRPNVYNPESDARDADLKQCKANYHPKLGRAKTKPRKIGHAKDPTYNIGSEGSGNSGSDGSTPPPPPCGGPRDPCPGAGGSGGSGSSSASKVLGPGLLESDSGASRNAPSARGAPSGSGSGGSLGGSTFTRGR